jgi:RNA polymerase sigma-70 factor (ECF subfamily)
VKDTDETLMERAREGDLAAFECLVDRFKVSVFSLVAHIVPAREDAEEAAQDTFLKLFKSRGLYESGRPVRPWILKIAANAARDMARRRRAQQQVSSDYLEDHGIELADPRHQPPPRHRIESEEVRLLIQEMGDAYRIPLVLKYLEGMNNQEIAALMDVSLSSLKVKLARAKDLLLQRIKRLQEKP